MPLLPHSSYSAQVGGLPISGGQQASMDSPLGTAARDFAGTVAKGADVVLQTMEETEQRKAAVSASEIRATYAKALDEAALSGADLEKLKEKMQADLQKVGESFQTRKGTSSVQMYLANATLMFDEQANHIAVQRSFAEAKAGASKLLNAESSTLQSFPTYLPNAIDNANAYVDTLTRIRPEQRAAIKDSLEKDLSMAAVLAHARVDPEGTRKKLDAGEFNLHPHQRDLALNRTDSEIRARRVEDAYIRADEERLTRQRDEDARDKHFKDIQAGTATRRAILDDPTLRPATREHLINYMDHRAKELRGEVKASDQQTVKDLWMRIHAPEDDPRRMHNGNAIFDAVEAGKLNTTDADRLNAAVGNMKDENNRSFGQKLYGRLRVVEAALRADPSLTGQPELQAAIQLELTSRVESAASNRRKVNESPGVLLDPESSDYFFKPGTLKAVTDDVRAAVRAQLPQPTDLRVKPEDAVNVAVGAAFIDPNGVTRVMSKELLEKLKKSGGRAPTAPEATPGSLSDVAAP